MAATVTVRRGKRRVGLGLGHERMRRPRRLAGGGGGETAAAKRVGRRASVAGEREGNERRKEGEKRLDSGGGDQGWGSGRLG